MLGSEWDVGAEKETAEAFSAKWAYLPLRLSSYMGLAISIITLVGSIVILFDKLVLGIGATF